MEIQNTQLSLEGLGAQSKSTGFEPRFAHTTNSRKLQYSRFFTKALMADLGLPPIQTAQPSALNNLGLTSTIHPKAMKYCCRMQCFVDETRFATAISLQQNSEELEPDWRVTR